MATNYPKTGSVISFIDSSLTGSNAILPGIVRLAANKYLVSYGNNQITGSAPIAVREITVATSSSEILDDFNRANENPISTPWTGPSSTGFAQLKIISNEIANGSSGDALSHLVSSSIENAYVEITLTNAGAANPDFGLSIRVVSQGNLYYVDCVNGLGVDFRKLVSNSQTDNSGWIGNTTFAEGDTLRLEAQTVGSTCVLTLYRNNIYHTTWTDSSSPHGAGYAGVMVYQTAHRLDNFRTGELDSDGLNTAEIGVLANSEFASSRFSQYNAEKESYWWTKIISLDTNKYLAGYPAYYPGFSLPTLEVHVLTSDGAGTYTWTNQTRSLAVADAGRPEPGDFFLDKESAGSYFVNSIASGSGDIRRQQWKINTTTNAISWRCGPTSDFGTGSGYPYSQVPISENLWMVIACKSSPSFSMAQHGGFNNFIFVTGEFYTSSIEASNEINGNVLSDGNSIITWIGDSDDYVYVAVLDTTAYVTPSIVTNPYALTIDGVAHSPRNPKILPLDNALNTFVSIYQWGDNGDIYARKIRYDSTTNEITGSEGYYKIKDGADGKTIDYYNAATLDIDSFAIAGGGSAYTFVTKMNQAETPSSPTRISEHVKIDGEPIPISPPVIVGGEDARTDLLDRQDLPFQKPLETTILNPDAFEDAEFTELITTIENVTANDFFTLYESLKDAVPQGGATVQVDYPLFVNQAKNLVSPNAKLASYNDVFTVDSVSVNKHFLINPYDRKSHSYLFSRSLNKLNISTLKNIDTEMYAAFTIMGTLYELSGSLHRQVLNVKRENRNLKIQNKTLKDLIKILSTEDKEVRFGFQAIPDRIEVRGTPEDPQIVVDVVKTSSTIFIFNASAFDELRTTILPDTAKNWFEITVLPISGESSQGKLGATHKIGLLSYMPPIGTFFLKVEGMQSGVVKESELIAIDAVTSEIIGDGFVGIPGFFPEGRTISLSLSTGVATALSVVSGIPPYIIGSISPPDVAEFINNGELINGKFLVIRARKVGKAEFILSDSGTNESKFEIVVSE